MNNRLKKIFFLPFLLPLCWIGTTVDMAQHEEKTQKCSQKLNQCLIETQTVLEETPVLADSSDSYEPVWKPEPNLSPSLFLIELFSVLFSLATLFTHRTHSYSIKKQYRLSLNQHTHYFRDLRLNANRTNLYLSTLCKLFHSRLQFIFSPQAFI